MAIADVLAKMVSAAVDLDGHLARSRGAGNGLLMELKRNLQTLTLWSRDNIELVAAVKKLERGRFEAAVADGHDLKKICRGTVRSKHVDDLPMLRHYTGRPTSSLIEDLYLKIHELQTLIDAAPGRRRVNLRARLINVMKRLTVVLRSLD